jgi:hypothetical protein
MQLQKKMQRRRRTARHALQPTSPDEPAFWPRGLGCLAHAVPARGSPKSTYGPVVKCSCKKKMQRRRRTARHALQPTSPDEPAFWPRGLGCLAHAVPARGSPEGTYGPAVKCSCKKKMQRRRRTAWHALRPTSPDEPAFWPRGLGCLAHAVPARGSPKSTYGPVVKCSCKKKMQRRRRTARHALRPTSPDEPAFWPRG